jgi:hypothetical protein
LASVSSSAATASAIVSVDRIATGSGTYAGVVVRQVGASFYQARARFQADGTVALQIMQGSSTVLANVTVPGITYGAGSRFSIKVEATGASPTTLRAKLWAAGSAEPAAWTLSATDVTAALQTAGSVGVESYVSGSATNAPVTISYDDFSVVTSQ